MDEDTLRQRIELDRAQATRDRSAFMRWIVLLAMNINRPTHSTLRFILGVVRGEYADATELQVQAQKEGMDTMYEDGLRKAVAGQTTIEEVLRVTTQQEQEA